LIDQIFLELADYGIIGLLIGWLIWKDTKLTARIFKVIENNTKAFIELKNEIRSNKNV